MTICELEIFKRLIKLIKLDSFPDIVRLSWSNERDDRANIYACIKMFLKWAEVSNFSEIPSVTRGSIKDAISLLYTVRPIINVNDVSIQWNLKFQVNWNSAINVLQSDFLLLNVFLKLNGLISLEWKELEKSFTHRWKEEILPFLKVGMTFL